MNLGLSLSLGSRMAGGASWLPSALFDASEQGVWYDPSDFSTMYQDNFGVTPVTAVGQSVGFLGDKSQGFALGPELVTNGDFSSSAGWALSFGTTVSGGTANFDGVTSATVNQPLIERPDLSAIAGKWYEVVYTITAPTTNVISFLFGSVLGEVRSAAGTYRQIIRAATSGTLQIVSRAVTGIRTGGIDNISVRELPGNHATQATAASRPVLGRVPFGGRRNLLTYTEQFDNAAWAKLGGGSGSAPTITANAGTAPNGTTTADRAVFNLNGGTASGDISRVYQPIAATGSLTFSFWVRSTDGVSNYDMYAVTPNGNANFTATGEWQRVDVSGNAPGTVFYSIGLRGAQPTTNSDTADVLLWGTQLETGSTATAYQRVTTAFDVTEVGVADNYYLQFDGTDDFLVTGNINFSATDEMTVIAGVRRETDTNSLIVELGANLPVGGFRLALPDVGRAQFSSRGSGTVASAISSTTAFTPPRTDVFTGLSKIASDTCVLRANGVQITTSAVDQGAGNYSTLPVTIGRTSTTIQPLSGHLYGLIVRGLTTAGTDLTNAETYMAGKTGVVL